MIEKGQQRLLRAGGLVTGYDVVIPRIGASITDYGLAVLATFERRGVPCVNAPLAIARSRDKLRALERLSVHDVAIPRTAMARDPSAIRAAIDSVGGTPVIIKLLQGTQGVGVMIADSPEGVESTLDTLWGLGQNIILQEFIAESRGRDVRALVVGGELVGAMRRTAKGREFRSNLHRGGAGEPVVLDDRYRDAAVRAAAIMGLDVAGVDILESADGPRVIEVNSSPGLRGIERATEVDVAQRIIAHAERLALGRPSAGPLEVGWCERVALPELGIERLAAKIDTGARTSALHVAAMRPAGETKEGRPLLDIEVPAGGKLGKTRAVRVEVVETTLVRGSGGHADHRPVIETVLRLGVAGHALEKRVRVSLTDRGDMRFPMLVGRTALGPELRVNPTRRFLLR